MASDLVSFKLLIHGYTLEKTFYQSIGDSIQNPGFAVQLFDFPTFIISSREKLSQEEIGSNQWIHFGNGKSTSFEMTEIQIEGYLNDRPLIINFIDAEIQQLRIFSKTIVTLQSFKDNIKTYYHQNQENWKRRIFLMYDEMKNEVGKIDLSISLVKRRKDSFNQTTKRSDQVLVYQQNIPLNPNNFPVYAQTSTFSKTEKQVEKLTKEERPKTSGYESQKFLNESEVFDSQSINNKATLKNFNNQERSNITGPITSLQTIIGGYYCPPVMLLQKKKKTVRFAGQENSLRASSSLPQQTKGNLLRSKSSHADSKSFFGSTGFNDFEKVSQPVGENGSRPVVLLSNKESERLVDLLKLKDPKEEKFSLVDLLISELVALRSGSQQTIDNVAKAESLRIGNLRNKDAQKDLKVGVSKKRSSFSKDVVDKNKENSDQNPLNTNFSPKRNRLDSFKGLMKGRDIVHEVIKETYEEANLPEEEYSQDFESLSASQSMPHSLGQNKKDIIPYSGKIKPTVYESIEESYPDDFEQLSEVSASHNFSTRYANKYSVKTGFIKNAEESKDISEEIAESGSGTISNSQPFLRKDYGKRDSKIVPDSGIRSSKVFSDYSEDFEALSEEN